MGNAKPGWAVTSTASSSRVDVSDFKKLDSEACKLVKDIDNAYIELAKVLSKVEKMFAKYGADKDAAKGALGYDSFAAWADGRLGWGRARAYHHAQIWDRLVVRAGVKQDDLAQMSWSKASMLAVAEGRGRMETTKQRDSLVEKAKTSTVEELKSDLRKDFAGDPEAQMTKLDFTVSLAQKANIEKALATAEKLTGSKARGHLLDLLATEFNATYPPSVSREAAIHSLGCRFEEAFGLKIALYHPHKGFVMGEKWVFEETKDAGRK